ncbi:ABC transporter ATP-binding protein [Lacibacterium aquatile]|uniref:ABC transporter ATP-binding protein n=1 Tax=Lacibacterium aquatile TaxID=1168082 RepID=A0ABW5DYQ1_9PROT
MSAILKVEGLVKRFGGITATDDCWLEVAAGEIHGLIGPNGAGKTTLLSQIAGSLKPSAGAIHFDGQAITGLPIHRRVGRGIVRSFQITNLYKTWRVRDAVALAVQARSGSSFRFWQPVQSEKALTDEAAAILASLDMAALGDRITGDLSHGEQRLVEIAMALATAPRLLLLDEPMAGLGPSESERLTEQLQALKGRYSLLLVEHDMAAVFRLSDRISVLVAGKVIASGLPDAIRNDDDVKRAYLGEEAI